MISCDFFNFFSQPNTFILILGGLDDKPNTMNNLKRVIVDFKKLTPEVLKLLVEKYPDGYGDNDVINFRNLKGELIEAVEVSTDDTKYLVKISSKLEHTMANFDDDDDDNDDTSDLDAREMDKLPDDDNDFSDSEEEE